MQTVDSCPLVAVLYFFPLSFKVFLSLTYQLVSAKLTLIAWPYNVFFSKAIGVNSHFHDRIPTRTCYTFLEDRFNAFFLLE